jgi:DNA-binding XRE family transcriptional regulator
MPTRPTTAALPLPVERVLRKLGRDVRDARLRRRIPTTVMAERASISRTTLNKAEKGDPGVSLGTYATILFILGLSDRLADLADIRKDTVGLELADEELPQRIRRRKKTGIPGPPAARKD